MSGEIRVNGRGEMGVAVESKGVGGTSRVIRAGGLRESAHVPHGFPTGTDGETEQDQGRKHDDRWTRVRRSEDDPASQSLVVDDVVAFPLVVRPIGAGAAQDEGRAVVHRSVEIGIPPGV